MRGIIDRFEGDLVVVEIDGETKDFPKSLFPTEVKSGDLVSIFDNEVIILIDGTKELRKEIEQLMEDVWED